MSGSVTSTTSGTTSTTSTAAASSASSSSVASATGQNALASLSSNFNDFLNLLMTQVQNQDPTSPMDSQSFTTELVQFSGVEQQITTNSNLGQLIQLTQGSDIMQSSSLVGKTVSGTATQIPLQNGSGSISFTTTASEPVSIAVTDASGHAIKSVTAQSAAGANTWTWDGTNNSGATEPNGAYNIAVTTTSASGASSSVPFDVVGTATGIARGTGASGVNVELGPVGMDMGSVQSLGN